MIRQQRGAYYRPAEKDTRTITICFTEFLNYMEILGLCPLEVNLWIMQNTYDEIAQDVYLDLDGTRAGERTGPEMGRSVQADGQPPFFKYRFDTAAGREEGSCVT